MKNILGLLVLIGFVAGGWWFLTTGQYALIQNPPFQPATSTPAFTIHPITLADGTSFNLDAPREYVITPAAEGLGRVRFMAVSPDNKLFVTDMHDLSDNKLGKIYILEKFNDTTKHFELKNTYLENLRNPNSIAFYQDTQGKWWLYVALTDKLVRYPYVAGDIVPSGRAQTIATFPDYGLSYKYGGWHLTRTIAIHNDKLYISVGSSCNSCEEKEPIRASIIELDPYGENMRYIARGLRNAVGLKWVGNNLYATNMGADHLGNDLPLESLYTIAPGTNYGWPYCYVATSTIAADISTKWQREPTACSIVPYPQATFPAHSAPLGLEFFDNNFLVALHGSGQVNIGAGYKIVSVTPEGEVTDLITGFLSSTGTRFGRPVDILKRDESSFFFTDDHKGVLYFVVVNRH